MTIYYQHIGEALSARDFPRSLGTQATGLKRFMFADIEQRIQHIPPEEILEVREKITEHAATGFQIWGLPSGADRVVRRMETGDFLMLLESTDFGYVGQVIHRMSEPCWDLSDHIWGEQRFPIIVLLQGELISYAWSDFLAHFGIAPNYQLRGRTASLADERVASSPSHTEEAFISMLLATKGTNPFDLEKDFSAFANNMEVHFRVVKERNQQQEFRRAVLAAQGKCCAVCNIDVAVAVEAAHVVPKEHDGTDDARNGIALCASHHRMFDANLFAIDPATLKIVALRGRHANQLHISRNDIRHLTGGPHRTALEWRWQQIEHLRH